MSHAPVIWIDLTDLRAWSGHHTGIQRVVYHLAYGYSKREDVRFFFYNDARRIFVETQFIPLTEDPGSSAADMAPSLKGRLKQKAVQTARGLAHRAPESWRRAILTPENKNRLRHNYHRGRHFLSKLRRSTIDRGPVGPEAVFSAGDTVLIMGKAWDYPNLMPDLGVLRRSLHFKLVQVIYDLIPSLHPHLFGPGLFRQYTQHMFEVAANSDGLVAISKSSKRDMERFCKELRLPVPPIGIMRLGDDVMSAAPHPGSVGSLEAGEYILCVGTLEVRKNHALLYSVWKLAKLRGIELPKLVIVGGRGWFTGDVIYALEHDPDVRDQIQIVSGISDSQLTWLYQNCRLTVFPAIYEGWGLPIAESLAYGKLCLPSSTSSMTEIAGDLLEYFEPFDAAACLNLIVKYLDKPVLASKEAEIASKYHPTSWDTTYEQFDTFVRSAY